MEYLHKSVFKRDGKWYSQSYQSGVKNETKAEIKLKKKLKVERWKAFKGLIKNYQKLHDKFMVNMETGDLVNLDAITIKERETGRDILTNSEWSLVSEKQAPTIKGFLFVMKSNEWEYYKKEGGNKAPTLLKLEHDIDCFCVLCLGYEQKQVKLLEN